MEKEFTYEAAVERYRKILENLGVKNMSKKIFNPSTFIISVDTELIWGYVSYPMHKSVSLVILTEMGTFGTTGQR